LPCDFFRFQKFKIVLKGGWFYENTMIHAKLWDALANFQTVHFTSCLEWRCSCCAHNIRSKVGYFEGDSSDLKVNVVM
jgi:hypothetical protein